ncbi:MAG TPA: hypothetical protein VLB44_15410 [Kofleriaceae bacterium]|nr:hypothetical protein [Kofleriaceae bacterium]
MKRYVVLVGLAACGGRASGPTTPHARVPQLQPTVMEQSWYRSKATCAQGPFELDVPVGNAKYGEAIELALRAPRRIALHAVILAGDAELATIDDVFDSTGRVGGSADNARCIADARERLAMERARRGTASTPGTATTSTPGAPAPTAPPPVSVAAELEVEQSGAIVGVPLLQLRIPAGTTSVRIRWWSVEPNDLEGVAFGLSRVVWQPNVSEAEYEAYLAEENRKSREATLRAEAQTRVTVAVTPEDPAKARARAEADARARAEAEARAAEQRRLRLEAEIRAAEQRKLYCATHGEDRSCWGPGGLRVHLDLEAHAKERTAYCGVHHEDARCFTDADWQRIHDADHERLTVVLTPSKPSGPPPAPLAETTPPKLSVHAQWRPGYWHWIDSTWVWLAGQWRVPEADIAAEQTTTAPAAPPPPQAETPPAPPVQAAVWTAGFWQWDGSTWVWIAGSWQLRPATAVTWRAATWQPRGSMHVLVPGGWVRIGGSR